LGKSLLEFSLDNLEKDIFELEVRVGNLAAIKLYEKFGFIKIKILESFYDDEDGVKMRLKR
jgi:ribosomal-protein-alanine N-acetyltransferase